MDEVAIPAANRFAQLMADAPGAVEIVAFVESMGKYETPGRQAWQKTLAEHRPRLAAVTLIQCKSALVRMATAAMCLYAGVKIRLVDDPVAASTFHREAREAALADSRQPRSDR